MSNKINQILKLLVKKWQSRKGQLLKYLNIYSDWLSNFIVSR